MRLNEGCEMGCLHPVSTDPNPTPHLHRSTHISTSLVPPSSLSLPLYPLHVFKYEEFKNIKYVENGRRSSHH